MRTGTGLKIQDYFQRVKFRTPPAGQGRTSQAGKSGGSFGRILDAACAPGTGRERHLTIQDYFKTAVSRPPVWSQEPPSAGAATPPLSPKLSDNPPQPAVQPAESMGAAQGPQTERAAIEAGIDRAADRYDLPPALIRAVIEAESNYRPRVVSPAGAQGLMQLMPATARELGVIDPLDIQQNIDGGARYLRQMLDRYDGDLKLALSAYNAGPGTVGRYKGDVPYAETRAYVARVMNGMAREANLVAEI